MIYVYCLKSKAYNWYYIGLTKNINTRIRAHNSGTNQSTKSKRPFELIFAQTFNNRELARDFEKYLKIRYNKESLLQVLSK